MERLPRRDRQVDRVGRMVCEFLRKYQTFIVCDETGNENAIIFTRDALRDVPFDENGNLTLEDVIDLLPGAIVPSLN